MLRDDDSLSFAHWVSLLILAFVLFLAATKCCGSV